MLHTVQKNKMLFHAGHNMYGKFSVFTRSSLDYELTAEKAKTISSRKFLLAVLAISNKTPRLV